MTRCMCLRSAETIEIPRPGEGPCPVHHRPDPTGAQANRPNDWQVGEHGRLRFVELFGTFRLSVLYAFVQSLGVDPADVQVGCGDSGLSTATWVTRDERA